MAPGPRVTGPSAAGPHKLKQKRELANDAAGGGTFSRVYKSLFSLSTLLLWEGPVFVFSSFPPVSSAPVIKAEVKSSKEEKRRMFFHIVLERNMQLHPRFFGRNLRENIVSKLMKDVEGTCRHVSFQHYAFFSWFSFNLSTAIGVEPKLGFFLYYY